MADNPVSSFLNLALLLGDQELALDEEFWAKACELRCAVPAVVVSFDAVKQTVVVQPAIKDILLLNLVPTPTNLPPLSNVPVLCYRGGGFTITLPLKAGDEGVVIFSDMAIDAWWQSGAAGTPPQPQPQVERRRHDLSDGMFYPGGWSQPRVLANYSTTALQVRSDDGQVSVTVEAGEVVATPDGGTTNVTLSAGSATIVATSIKLQGDVEVTGSFTADGTVFIGGGNYLLHEHTDVTTGSSNTGPVFP